MRRFTLITLLIFVAAMTARAADATPDQLFAQANDIFAQATAQRATDEAKARTLYAQSITLYQQIIDQHAIKSGDLYYNIANAYALSGDLGRAIVNYRRALPLAPADPDLAANLRTTRAKVGVAVEAKGGSQLTRELVSWHRAIQQRTRLIVALAAFGGVWLVLIARLSDGGRKWASRWIAIALAIASTLAGLSLWTEHRSRLAHPEAVVVADSVVGRKGPDERGYEPSFTRPLSAGVELTIIERRAGWALVRLADARETWLPAGSWEEI